MQESNSNSSALDNTIMVYKDHATCNLTTYNHSQSIPETSWRTKAKPPLYPKLQMLAFLISNQFHLQHQFRQMHKQLYQQHGETLPKQNTTVHSKDGQTFVVKGISIHCNQIQ